MTTTTDLAVRAETSATATYDQAAKELTIATQIPGVNLVFRTGQKVLDDDQLVLLAPLGIKADWDPRHVAAFLMECQSRALDPWRREAYLMFYPDRDGGKFVRHIGIDGFRARGESSGGYRGRTTPLFCGPDGVWREIWPHTDKAPFAAKVGIIRDGFDDIQYAIAYYAEYAPMMDEWAGPSGKRERTGRRLPTPTWRPSGEGGKPTVMLAKCAEAQAWRIAFPRNFNGFYVPEEFEKDRPATDDAAAARRRAAHAAATTAPPADPVVDAEIVHETPAADPAAGGRGRDDKALLRAELEEQAEVLGRTVAAFTERWSQSRDGRVIGDASVEELREFVHRARPWVVKALRDAGRDDEADVYAQAPDVGTVRELFGRGPAVPEPPAVDQ